MWCFGVTAHQRVTGKQLFECDAAQNVDDKELELIADWLDQTKSRKSNKIDGEKWGSLKVLLAKLLRKNPADRPENWAEVVHLVDQGDTDGLKEQLARIDEKLNTGFADLKETLTDQLGKLNDAMEERFTSLTQFVTLTEEVQAPCLFR